MTPSRPADNNGRSGSQEQAPAEQRQQPGVSPSPSKYTSKELTGHIGLYNQGATCYLNTLIQLLFHTGYFRSAVYQIPSDGEAAEENSIPRALQNLFYQLQAKRSAASTKCLTDVFGWTQNEAFVQHDIHEMAALLRDNLEEKMKGTPAEGMVEQLFAGRGEQLIRCLDDSYQSSTKETFYDIHVPVKDQTSLESSLESLIAKEKLTDDNKYCVEQEGKPRVYKDAEKGYRFISFPPVILFHLKRFEMDLLSPTLEMKKINSAFHFEEDLDLSRFELSTDVDEKTRQRFGDYCPPDYVLYSVTVHRGGVRSGHYYCFLRAWDHDVNDWSNWLKFEDEHVSVATREEVIDANLGGAMRYEGSAGHTVTAPSAQSAYILAYVRRGYIPAVFRPSSTAEIPLSAQREFQRVLDEEEQQEREQEERSKQIQFSVVTEEDVRSMLRHRQCNGFPSVKQESIAQRKFVMKKRKTLADLLAKVAEQADVRDPQLLRLHGVRSHEGQYKVQIVIQPGSAGLQTTLQELFQDYHKPNCLWIEYLYAEVASAKGYIPYMLSSYKVATDEEGIPAVELQANCPFTQQRPLECIFQNYAVCDDPPQRAVVVATLPDAVPVCGVQFGVAQAATSPTNVATFSVELFDDQWNPTHAPVRETSSLLGYGEQTTKHTVGTITRNHLGFILITESLAERRPTKYIRITRSVDGCDSPSRSGSVGTANAGPEGPPGGKLPPIGSSSPTAAPIQLWLTKLQILQPRAPSLSAKVDGPHFMPIVDGMLALVKIYNPVDVTVDFGGTFVVEHGVHIERYMPQLRLMCNCSQDNCPLTVYEELGPGHLRQLDPWHPIHLDRSTNVGAITLVVQPDVTATAQGQTNKYGDHLRTAAEHFRFEWYKRTVEIRDVTRPNVPMCQMDDMLATFTVEDIRKAIGRKMREDPNYIRICLPNADGQPTLSYYFRHAPDTLEQMFRGRTDGLLLFALKTEVPVEVLDNQIHIRLAFVTVDGKKELFAEHFTFNEGATVLSASSTVLKAMRATPETAALASVEGKSFMFVAVRDHKIFAMYDAGERLLLSQLAPHCVYQVREQPPLVPSVPKTVRQHVATVYHTDLAEGRSGHSHSNPFVTYVTEAETVSEALYRLLAIVGLSKDAVRYEPWGLMMLDNDNNLLYFQDINAALYPFVSSCRTISLVLNVCKPKEEIGLHYVAENTPKLEIERKKKDAR